MYTERKEEMPKSAIAEAEQRPLADSLNEKQQFAAERVPPTDWIGTRFSLIPQILSNIIFADVYPHHIW
jgi:hypothetical protein